MLGYMLIGLTKGDQYLMSSKNSTSSKISYDFILGSCVAVEAPIGTNPETLVDKAKQKFIDRLRSGDVEVVFENIFDSETGAWDEDWENYIRE